MNPQEYRENRARLPHVALDQYQGQWVAFSLDGSKIIASHADLAALDSLIVAAGQNPEQVALERIAWDDVYLGGAEFQ